jgi:hypothetical protein
MSKKAAELSHKQEQRGQDKEQCRLGDGIWNTQTLGEAVRKHHSILMIRGYVNEIMYMFV